MVQDPKMRKMYHEARISPALCLFECPEDDKELKGCATMHRGHLTCRCRIARHWGGLCMEYGLLFYWRFDWFSSVLNRAGPLEDLDGSLSTILA